MRQFRTFNIPAGGRWPEGSGGGGWEVPRFNWLRIHHRSPNNTLGLAVSIDGSPVSSETLDLAWDIWLPGETRTRNIGGPQDNWANEIHLVNLDLVNPALGVIEIADNPIIDVGFKLSTSGGATTDVSDRAARLLGTVSPVAGSTWDVSDRAARALGAISAAAGATFDVADRAGRALGAVAFAAASLFADNADNEAANAGATDLLAKVRLQGFNGAGWDRLRTLSAVNLAALSGIGGHISAPPGMWTALNAPAANVAATITRAAGAAGVRHVAWAVLATVTAEAAAPAAAAIDVVLRDGLTGAGAIIWQDRLVVQAVAGTRSSTGFVMLNLPGSAATAMTLEFTAAGGANTVERVVLLGYDVS